MPISQREKEYYERNKEAIRQRRRNEYHALPAEERKQRTDRWRRRYLDSASGTAGRLLTTARNNAKTRDIPFDLTKEDVKIPDRCPVLDIPLFSTSANVGTRKRNDNAPSIDRIDPSKGYTKDNIRVISWRANHLINDGTVDEFEKIASYLRLTAPLV